MIVIVKGISLSANETAWTVIKEYDSLITVMEDYTLSDSNLLEYRKKSHCRVSLDPNPEGWNGVDFTYLINTKTSKVPTSLEDVIRDWKIATILE